MIRTLINRIGILFLVGWVLTLLPSPTEWMPLRLKNGLVGIGMVLGVGKLLYDTLFYDRYMQ